MALLRRRGEVREERAGVLRGLGSAFMNPLSLTLGTVAVASAVGDGIFDLGWLAPVTPLLLLGIAAREKINTQAKKYDAEAETFPPRPDDVENPIDPDVVIAGYGGSTIRGVETDQRKQVGAVIQRIVAEELGAVWGISDLKVAFINTMTKAEANARDMSGQTNWMRGLLTGQFKGKSPAASVAIPDIGDSRSLEEFNGNDFGDFFGATVSKAKRAVAPLGDAPLVLATPHDFSRAPSVKWYTRWKFRGKVREHSEGMVNVADQFNRNRDGRPVVVARLDQGVSKVLASNPERYFDRRLGRNLGEEGHELLGRELAGTLIPTSLEHAAALNDEQGQWRNRVAAAQRAVRQTRPSRRGTPAVPGDESARSPDWAAAREELAKTKLGAAQAKASYGRQFSPRVRVAIPGAVERHRHGRGESTPSRQPAA